MCEKCDEIMTDEQKKEIFKASTNLAKEIHNKANLHLALESTVTESISVSIAHAHLIGMFIADFAAQQFATAGDTPEERQKAKEFIIGMIDICLEDGANKIKQIKASPIFQKVMALKNKVHEVPEFPLNSIPESAIIKE